MQQMVDTAEAEGSPLEPQAQGRGGTLKMAWLFKFSMAHLQEHPSSNKATPPKSPNSTNWGLSIQTSEPVGGFLPERIKNRSRRVPTEGSAKVCPSENTHVQQG